MELTKRRSTSMQGRDLIALAQQLARDAERHALLSETLARQANRLLIEGLEQLDSHESPVTGRTPRSPLAP